MDAIILAGGFGTRLRPLTLGTPKPMVPLANQPFLATLLHRLAKAGVERAVLSAFHQAGELRRSLPRFKRFGIRLSVVAEREPLGTGGAIRYAWLDPRRPTLALNGDALSDFDIRTLLASHRARRAHCSLWVRPVEDPSAFGVIESRRDGAITRFIEKPRPGETDSRAINAGVYVLEPEVRALIPEGRAVSVERETFPALLAHGLRSFAFHGSPKAYWRDIGRPEEYLQANLDVLDGVLPSYQAKPRPLWARPGRGRVLLAPGCRVAAGARLERSVLGAGCSVASQAELNASVLWEGCRIGAGARVQGALLGRGVMVGEHAWLRPGTVLGDRAVVPAYSVV
jgi:NDP-sugar pyrophosphorylase family protein